MSAAAITFAFVREGTSDNGLLPHLQNLVIRAGASEAIGTLREIRGTTKEKLSELCANSDQFDIVFVHRDSDTHGDGGRYAEIESAVQVCSPPFVVVGVVPIQATEAWLLTDESSIREVMGRPSGRASLGLPSIREIERRADPKSILKSACMAASEASGRRRASEARSFPVRRSTLLQRLDIDGSVTGLSSWQRLVRDVDSAVAKVVARK